MQSFVLLLSSYGGPALPVSTLHLYVPHQAVKETYIPEVHPPDDPCPNFLGPVDAQHICDNNVGKE